MKKQTVKKQYKRLGAAALAVALTLQGTGGIASVSAEDAEVVQMTSAPETVYVNTYSDPTVRTQDFDSNWKFYLGDLSNAQETTYDDSTWTQVSLPHDYSIEQDYSQSMEAESGYLPGGTGWYRKHFTLSKEMEGSELRIDFGGVYMNATVWINGTELGTHPYGYTPFSFDITEYVDYDTENVLTVKVEHRTPSSRFYSGSGIYRNVNLVVTKPVHVDLYGTKITTPKLEEQHNSAVDMEVKTTVANAGDKEASVTLTHTVFPKNGSEEDKIGTFSTEAQTVPAGETKEISATVPVQQPELWSVESPKLYTVRTQVKVGEEVVDTYDTEYGFRYFKFDKDTGFSLNGVSMKLKGVCMHHDQGSLGSEAYYRATERQVEILKEMGCNAIRVTHNPASNELIQICNEKGIMLIEEAFDGWTRPKNGNSRDYSTAFNVKIDSSNKILGREDDMTWAKFDLRAMINRGYNAPSIIMWSLGNEIWEGTDDTADWLGITKTLIQWAQEVDKTRPLTTGDNRLKGQNATARAIADALAESGGVVGFNYANGSQYATRKDTWPIYGSETASSVNSRGFYGRTGDTGRTSDKMLTSYDNSKVGWGALASEAWYEVLQKDYVAGEFVWTGFDYLGEPTHWNGTGPGAQGVWPSPKNSYFGIIDTAGFPKDSYYFYQSQWNDKVHTLHILPAWNKDVVVSGSTVPVVVYTDAASVKLYFTPKGGQKTLVGEKEFTEVTTDAKFKYQIYQGQDKDSTAHKNLYLTWNLAYQDGTLEAVAYDKDGKEIEDTIGRSKVTTTGAAKKLAAEADRTTITADGKDLSYITVDVTDADGNIVPNAENLVKFEVKGDGVLVGVDNGRQDDHQSYQDDSRHAFAGKVLAIVQSTKKAGEFTVTATADGLESSTVKVTTTPAAGATAQAALDSFLMVKNYYVKTGNKPQLPEKLTAQFTDNTSKELTVKWDTITNDQVKEAGSFIVNGVVDDKYTVSVTVNMIEEIGALLNYSTSVSVGVEPALPASRPAVMPDGTILSTEFPVTWAEAEEGAYDKEGTVVVKGTASVLGKALEVTASVRVQGESLTLGGSVSGAADLTQEIGGNDPSDNLDAIKDGVTDNVSEENARWTNWNSAQAKNHESEITFTYATQQRIGQIVIYFMMDSNSASYPDAGTTKIYISDSGTEDDWEEVTAKETIPETEVSERVKAYTYDFEPFMATYIKFHFTDSTTRTGISKEPCTGITEIALLSVSGEFVKYSTAGLSSLTVNEAELTAAQLASGSYFIEEGAAEIEAVAADNAAVTILPAYQDVIRILLEAEDQSKLSVFEVHLNAEIPEDPADDSRDYPREKTTATAGSEYSSQAAGDGPASYVLDDSTATWWHTDWSGSHTSDIDERWIILEAQEVTTFDAVRYLPRDASVNGRVTEYLVEYSVDGEEWIEIASGEWESSSGWKLAKFDQPVNAKYVRLTGVHTDGDSGTDKFMSAMEMRLRLAPGAAVVDKNVESISVKTQPAKTTYKAGENFDPTGLAITVAYDDDSESTVTYGTGNAADFSFSPSLTTKLAVTDKKVTVTYGGKTADIEITVEASSVTPSPVDKTKLEEKIKEYEALNKDAYTETSWNALAEALADAEAVVEKTDATQEEVDAALAELEEARAGLVKRFDKKALEDLVAKYEAEELKDSDFTEETWAVFAVALENAQELLEAEDVTEDELTEAYTDLKDAYNSLILKDLPFTDVTEGDWFNDEVSFTYWKKLMTGKSESVFAPSETLARAQFAVILWRMEGEPDIAYTQEFPDVPDGQFYTKAVLWAAKNGIITGYTNNKHFGPADNINREQMAVMMYRYANYKKYDTTLSQDLTSFPDAGKVSGFATDAMKWCTAMKIITGDKGNLNPQGNTLRAECAAIISRFVKAYD